MSRVGMLAVAGAMAMTGTATLAQDAFELAFREGTLDPLAAGDRLEYESDVSSPAWAGTHLSSGAGAASVSVVLVDDDSATLGMRDEAGQRTLGRFDASVGNPLAMYFLERTVRAVSEGTGGSDVYLRNRIKDALRSPERVASVEIDWQGETVDATEIVLAPFEGDPNGAKLGRFGDMRIRLVVGDVPGWYHSLQADAGDGAFSSHLSLTDVTR